MNTNFHQNCFLGFCHNIFRELVTFGKRVQKREEGIEIKYAPTKEEKNQNKTRVLLHQSNDLKQ